MLTLPLSEPVAPHALMAPARRVMSHEYGSTHFDFKIQMSWFLPVKSESHFTIKVSSTFGKINVRVRRYSCKK